MWFIIDAFALVLPILLPICVCVTPRIAPTIAKSAFKGCKVLVLHNHIQHIIVPNSQASQGCALTVIHSPTHAPKKEERIKNAV